MAIARVGQESVGSPHPHQKPTPAFVWYFYDSVSKFDYKYKCSPLQKADSIHETELTMLLTFLKCSSPSLIRGTESNIRYNRRERDNRETKTK